MRIAPWPSGSGMRISTRMAMHLAIRGAGRPTAGPFFSRPKRTRAGPYSQGWGSASERGRPPENLSTSPAEIKCQHIFARAAAQVPHRVTVESSMSLSGKTICFTGALAQKRADAKKLAESCGAKGTLPVMSCTALAFLMSHFWCKTDSLSLPVTPRLLSRSWLFRLEKHGLPRMWC